MTAKKPTALKVLQGNPGKRPLPENEPRLQVEVPRTPPHLSPVAKKHFPKIAKQLAAMKVMTKQDTDALVIYCEAYARWYKANQELLTCDWVTKTDNGYPVQTPWLSISNKAFIEMKTMLTEFGLTPASRTKVQMIGDDGGAKDPWSQV